MLLSLNIHSDLQIGRKNPDTLAPDFRFEFPIIKLDKKVVLLYYGR